MNPPNFHFHANNLIPLSTRLKTGSSISRPIHSSQIDWHQMKHHTDYICVACCQELLKGHKSRIETSLYCLHCMYCEGSRLGPFCHGGNVPPSHDDNRNDEGRMMIWFYRIVWQWQYWKNIILLKLLTMFYLPPPPILPPPPFQWQTLTHNDIILTCNSFWTGAWSRDLFQGDRKM